LEDVLVILLLLSLCFIGELEELHQQMQQISQLPHRHLLMLLLVHFGVNELIVDYFRFNVIVAKQ